MYTVYCVRLHVLCFVIQLPVLHFFGFVSWVLCECTWNENWIKHCWFTFFCPHHCPPIALVALTFGSRLCFDCACICNKFIMRVHWKRMFTHTVLTVSVSVSLVSNMVFGYFQILKQMEMTSTLLPVNLLVFEKSFVVRAQQLCIKVPTSRMQMNKCEMGTCLTKRTHTSSD